MEEVVDQVELDIRRQNVAAFIQTSLKPARHLLEEGLLGDIGEDATDEAQDFEVREYQLDAWGALWDARQAGAKTGLIHLATGLGKTSVGVFDVIKFRDEYEGRRKRGPRVLFASHKNEINEQAAERFAAFIPGATQGFFNGESKVKDADITFATLQSLHGSLDTFKPGYFDYIIYDEAHHGKAETFEAVIKHFKPRFQLALTATPNRLDKLNIRELFGHELYSKSLAEALAEGWLADPDYHIVFDDAVKEAMQSGFEPTSLRALAELFNVEPRNEVIAKNIREEMERIGLEFGNVKTIVFCQNIQHAAEMAELLGGKPYHSKIKNQQERKATLDAFRHGDLQVITTRDMFNEGVDIPDARLLVFLRSTSSQTIFEQQLGRGLRKHKDKNTVLVLDFVANLERIAIVRELAENVRSFTDKVRARSTGVNSDSGFKGESSAVSNGIAIHTEHASFDFDKLSVDLLRRLSELSDVIEVPESYISMGGIAGELGVHRVRVVNAARRLGITSIKGLGLAHNRPAIYYSEEDGLAIKRHLKERLEKEPKSAEAVDIKLLDLADKWLLGVSTLERVSRLAGIKPKRLRDLQDKHKGLFDYITAEQMETLETYIRESLPSRPRQWPPDRGYTTIVGIAKLLETRENVVEQLAIEADLRPTLYISSSGRQQRLIFFTDKQVEYIRELYNTKGNDSK